MKDKKMLFGIGIAFLFLATIGFSYAYFSSAIRNDNVKNQVVTTGTLELTYTDGAEINMQNIKPGQTITKKVTVKNTGTLDTNYNLVWQELNNTITNDEMIISATCKRLNGSTAEGTCEGVDETPISKSIIKKNISIESGITHEYNVTITFKETNSSQNYNQGKTFSGILGINEYKAPETIYCTFDGEMVQGAEYVNGQYTYRYMQEGITSTSGLSWQNIATEGWGVQLTDKTSTDVVNSKVCTYINNVPVTSYASMFDNSKSTLIDVSTFDTSNVTNMKAMFRYTESLNLDVSGFNTSNVTDMSSMFQYAKANTLELSNFNTSNVTNMSSMFLWCYSKSLDLSNFDTSNVTNMYAMFSHYNQGVSIDISSFDTSKVTDMSSMFNFCMNIKTIYVSEKFVTTSVVNSDKMFNWDMSLVGGAGTLYTDEYEDATYARIDGGTSSPGYFTLKQ